jgi:hypothetical protein
MQTTVPCVSDVSHDGGAVSIQPGLYWVGVVGDKYEPGKLTSTGGEVVWIEPTTIRGMFTLTARATNRQAEGTGLTAALAESANGRAPRTNS